MHVCVCVSLPSSDEDTDVGALVKSWLSGQPQECRANLENWLADYFHRALDWVLKQVNTTLLSDGYMGIETCLRREFLHNLVILILFFILFFY